jgi:hypothetical protein
MGTAAVATRKSKVTTWSPCCLLCIPSQSEPCCLFLTHDCCVVVMWQSMHDVAWCGVCVFLCSLVIW